MLNRLQHLQDAGVSIWLDDLSRELLDGGEFMRLIREHAVSGATSNPTIFAKAITGSERYDDQVRRALDHGETDPQEIFFDLALDDVHRGADALRAVYELSDGRDGFVSFECTPDLADDADATIGQALDVWNRVSVPNLLIKVAATDAGIDAIEELTARGVSVNVTLLFSVRRYEQAIGAYWAGLERRLEAGQQIDQISSVASFFVSRIDAIVDRELPADSPLRGRIAIANAQIAYARHLRSLESERWQRLAAQGARVQRPLWASTATKDPEYSDVRYVEELIAPETISTIPITTLRAFADHGDVGASLGGDATHPERLLAGLADAGVDLDAITDELERAGVESFRDSYDEGLDRIKAKVIEADSELREHAVV